MNLLTSTPSKGELIALNKNISISRDLKLLNRSYALQWPYTYIHNSTVIKNAIEKYGDKYDLIHYHGTHILNLNLIKKKNPLFVTLHGIFPSCIAFWGIENWCGDTPSAYKCAQCVIKFRKSYTPLLPAMFLYNNYYYNKIDKSLKNINKIIAVSNYVKNIIKKTYNLNNISTIYNFIDTENDIYMNLNKMKHNKDNYINNNSKLILFSGRISKQKGVITLLDAFKLIRNKDITLALSGDGELIDKIKTMQKDYQNIILLGYLDRTEQLRLLSNCDVFVAPSSYPDACPTSILEAMALGKPIVATNIGGIPELVEQNENGFLIEPNKPEVLAEKIIQVLETNPDKYRDKCINKAKKFDITVQGEKIIAEYEKIVKS